MMKGFIGFDGLSVECWIGCTSEEREKVQKILIDLKLRTDLTRCTETDNLADTINYVDLSDLCMQIANAKKYNLLETLAKTICDALKKDQRIEWLWIRLNKSPEGFHAKQAFVELEWKR